MEGEIDSPIWYWEMNQGSLRQGHIAEVDLSSIGLVHEYLPAIMSGMYRSHKSTVNNAIH